MHRTMITSRLLLLLFCNMLLTITLFLPRQSTWAQGMPTEANAPMAQTSSIAQSIDAAPIKQFTGIHLGNKHPNLPDWSQGELARLEPRYGGTWPSLIVLLSSQFYNINRTAYPECRIIDATIRRRYENPLLYDFVKQAAQAGSKVVIRIAPSPGTRQQIPVEATTCGAKTEHYRPAQDIAEEIIAISDLNQDEGIPVFGFEPANEPNGEWYGSGIQPRINVSDSWKEMDNYFSAVWEHVVTNGGLNIQLFTPPMSQNQYAEGYEMSFGNCKTQSLIDNGSIGYNQMPLTHYHYHGISWHNYWRLGAESYVNCQAGGMHVSWYFPPQMKQAMHDGKPAIITEAGLLSPAQGGNIDNKHTHDPQSIADSLRRFFYEEWLHGGSAAHYGGRPNIALWLINDNNTLGDNFGSNPNLTNDNTHEHDWHEAYVDHFDANMHLFYTESQWFVEWYTRPEAWQPHFRVFLGGTYNRENGLMNHELRSRGMLPATEPYTALNYQHHGGGGNETMTIDAQQISIGADAPVDWVVVELRDANNPSTVVATRAALVQRDGDIVDVDGMTPVTFRDDQLGYYYVAVRHRNHLGVMTKDPIWLQNAPTIDFTASAVATYGIHAQYVIDRSSTTSSDTASNKVAMLWGGDANGDHRVIAGGPNNDKNAVLTTIFLAPGNTSYASNYVVVGYHRTDLNLDGQVIAAGPGNDMNTINVSVLSHPGNPTFNQNFVIDEQLP